MALAAAALTALLFGVVVSTVGDGQATPLPWLSDLRDSLQVVTGAIFFGAGLLHISVARMEGDRLRGQGGLTLVVYGFLAPWITGLGHLIHDDETQAVLSPVTTSFIAVVALLLGVAGLGRVLPATVDARTHLAGAVGLLLLLLLAPLVLRSGLSATLDLPTAWHFWLEGTVAITWFTAALLAEAYRRRTGVVMTGVTFGVLGCMGLVWVFRAAAVVALEPWSAAAAVLLASVGLVVLVHAVVDFTESAAAAESRVSSVEDTLDEVATALASLDRQRRDLAHDARNAILALQAASQTLADHGDEFEQEVRHRLRRAITEQLVHLGRLFTESGSAASGDFDLSEVVRSVAELERCNGVEVELDLQPCRVHADPDDVGRVIGNLLANARQHAPGSKVCVRVRRGRDHARLVVEDDGPGIPPRLRTSVFGRTVTGVASDGTGLGLHLGRALVQRHGGSLELADRAGPGARFVVTLPLADLSGSTSLPSQRVLAEETVPA